MATRPIFIVGENSNFLVETKFLNFEWFPGFAVSQKQKSITAMHSAANSKLHLDKILEISSKSLTSLGVELSAFNLKIITKKLQKSFSVECAFQASKVFENGGPFIDLLDKTSIEAKKDPRIKTSGKLLNFKFYNTTWPLEPKTAFYDWLYLNALHNNESLARAVLEFNSFTDIEFNHEKSINCQAYSAALYVSLYKKGLLDFSLESQENFLKTISDFSISIANSNIGIQQSLL
ncbi:DarT1-associated NADAR antitoxin family protein [Aeromonas rivipollensis]|uniref:DarT1-associated NADAR antitoxin family protein n=1 Tax=Aeromonas rivipollensis TaxID=948519 RepID=UPI00259E7A7D|nr:hypothetical protein [Aeromonas rivipollensis]MDM5121667.1 hypothetical protein [Aeromonas rivipollensis]